MTSGEDSDKGSQTSLVRFPYTEDPEPLRTPNHPSGAFHPGHLPTDMRRSTHRQPQRAVKNQAPVCYTNPVLPFLPTAQPHRKSATGMTYLDRLPVGEPYDAISSSETLGHASPSDAMVRHPAVPLNHTLVQMMLHNLQLHCNHLNLTTDAVPMVTIQGPQIPDTFSNEGSNEDSDGYATTSFCGPDDPDDTDRDGGWYGERRSSDPQYHLEINLSPFFGSHNTRTPTQHQHTNSLGLSLPSETNQGQMFVQADSPSKVTFPIDLTHEDGGRPSDVDDDSESDYGYTPTVIFVNVLNQEQLI